MIAGRARCRIWSPENVQLKRSARADDSGNTLYVRERAHHVQPTLSLQQLIDFSGRMSALSNDVIAAAEPSNPLDVAKRCEVEAAAKFDLAKVPSAH